MTEQRKPGETTQAVGQALSSCGCILFLIPFLIICLAMMYVALASMFHG